MRGIGGRRRTLAVGVISAAAGAALIPGAISVAQTTFSDVRVVNTSTEAVPVKGTVTTSSSSKTKVMNTAAEAVPVATRPVQQHWQVGKRLSLTEAGCTGNCWSLKEVSTFTVPTGKVLRVTNVSGHVTSPNPATSGGSIWIYLERNGSDDVATPFTTSGKRAVNQEVNFVVPAGQVLTVRLAYSGISPSLLVETSVSGVLEDAITAPGPAPSPVADAAARTARTSR